MIMNAKFNSICPICNQIIQKGSQIFYISGDPAIHIDCHKFELGCHITYQRSNIQPLYGIIAEKDVPNYPDSYRVFIIENNGKDITEDICSKDFLLSTNVNSKHFVKLEKYYKNWLNTKNTNKVKSTDSTELWEFTVKCKGIETAKEMFKKAGLKIPS